MPVMPRDGLEPGELQGAVLGLADEHAVHLRHASHRHLRRGGGVRPEAEDRRSVAMLQPAHFGDVGVERRRRAGEENQRRREPLAVEARDDVVGRQPLRGGVDRAGRRSRPRAAATAMTASVYGGLVVPSTSSRSWQRPCRVNAMPLMSGGFRSSVCRPSMESADHRKGNHPPAGRFDAGAERLGERLGRELDLAAPAADRKDALLDEPPPHLDVPSHRSRFPRASSSPGRPPRRE